MDVFFQELKRQLNFKRVMVYVLIAIMLAGLWTRFIVGGASEGFMMTECYKDYKGKAAIEVAAKDRNVTAGEMSEDKFQRGCDLFLDALKGDDEKDIVVNKDLLKYAVYADSLVMQQILIRRINGESLEGYIHIPKDAGNHFYDNENLYYRKYIEKNAHNEQEKMVALSMWDKIKKPYTYYSGFMQWSDGIEHIQKISFVLLVMAGIFAVSIIAKDKENGMDEIITTTAKGRKGLTAAKIIIPLIMASIIYLCGVGIYIVLLRLLLPLDALNTQIQVYNRSFLPFNVGKLLKISFVFGWVGILTVTSFSTFVSSIVKKSSKAIIFSVLTILGVSLLNWFISMKSPIIDIIKVLLPGGIVFSYDHFFNFPMVTLAGKVVWIPLVSLVVSGIVFLLSTVFAALNYTRR